MWLAVLSGTALALAAALSPAADAPAPRGDPAARLSAASGATEYWDLTASFDSGHRLLVRFLITNEGPGEQTAAANGFLVHPDGHRTEFRNGRRQGEWTLTPDRLHIDVASSSLDLRGPRRRLEIDSTSQGVRIDVQFPAGGASASPAQPVGWNYWTDAAQISAPAQGTIWVRGMAAPIAVRGTIALTHTWMDESESSLVQRRIEFVGGQPDLAVYLSDITTPSGDRRSWLALQRDGAIALQTSELELELGPAVAHGEPDYPVPGEILVRNADVTLRIRTERPLLRINPLDAVPHPFRFFLSLRSSPQRVWAEASFELRRGGGEGAAINAEGRGILAVNFLNPQRSPE